MVSQSNLPQANSPKKEDPKEPHASQRHSGRSIDPEGLKNLGMPQAVIDEAVANAKLGLFAIAPSKEEAKKTLDACEPFFPRGNKA